MIRREREKGRERERVIERERDGDCSDAHGTAVIL